MREWLIKHLLLLGLLFYTTSLLAADLTLQPRIQVNAPNVEFSDNVQTWLKKNPVITVGVWGPEHPPLVVGMSRGQYQGIGADYLTLLENTLNVEFALKYYSTSSDALAALSRHDIQMLAMWNPTRWPDKAAVATMPWLLDESVLLSRTNTDADSVKRRNMILGVVADGVSPISLRKDYPDSILRYFSEFDEAINALSFNQVDGLWMNRATALYLLRYSQISGLKLNPVMADSNLNLSFAVDRQLPELLVALNSSLQRIPLVSRLRIAMGWTLDRKAVITHNPLGLSVDEEAWLRANRNIRVLIDVRRPPISFLNKEGEPAGLVVDILENLTQRYAINFDLVTYDNDVQRAKLRDENPDALTANDWLLPDIDEGASSEQHKNSAALLSSPMIVIMSSSIERPTNFNELKNERLAINRDNPLIGWLETWFPTLSLVKTENLYQAMDLLKAGAIRGVIAPQFVADYLIENNSGSTPRIAVTVPVTSAELVIGSLGHNNLPISIISKALFDVPPEEMMNLINNWRYKVLNKKFGLSRGAFWGALIISALALMTLISSAIWIRKLHRALIRGQQSQKSLTDQLNFTRTLLDNTPVALYARDTYGKLLNYNHSWESTVSLTGESQLGKTINELTSMEISVRDLLMQKYQLALQHGENQYWEGSISVGGQQRYLKGWAVPWRDNQDEIGGLIGGWLDVTEQHHLIERLKRAKHELEYVNASKAAFMQSMGHEVRTPLNAIIGLLEIELQSSHQSSENLPLIWESACNLLSLIGDVFDIFRADNQSLHGVVRSVHLSQLIHSTVALYCLQAEEKGIKIEVETAIKCERVEADALQLIRIFSSLLRNAIKHSIGNKVSVALFQGRQEEGSSQIPLVIEVTNEGLLDESIMDEITLSIDEKKGWSETGINIAGCQKIAASLGGELVIESDEKEGTVISLYFSAYASHETVPGQLFPTLPQHQLHIMIVDDYSPGRHALQQQLTGAGHRVTTAENGEQALLCWQRQPDAFDLIITDCTMPLMDGFVFSEQIRAAEKQRGSRAVPIFALTAMTGFETTTKCLQAGMNECLIKPLSPQALQVIIKRYFPATTNDTQANVALKFDAELLEVNVKDAHSLKMLIEKRDKPAIARIAHRIRGGAGLVKDDSLYNACEALERACERSAEWQEIEKLALDVNISLDQLNNNIGRDIHPKDCDI